MGALMSVTPKASTSAWPTPPEGGWTADGLDRLPALPPHTELIDGSLVFANPQTLFHTSVGIFRERMKVSAPFPLDLDLTHQATPRRRIARCG
ncbi:hypothetical protein GCM10023220_04850 [Streptomyces ziwulingensis]|uniref:Uncharacterized protein n=1 Tax=Streptomyces ziwulingensis TaxID=1045501 RepID=A0ABP9ASV9_9ACTN